MSGANGVRDNFQVRFALAEHLLENYTVADGTGALQPKAGTISTASS